MNDKILESAKRLYRNQMISQDFDHIWNAHGQCQWCHGMRRDYDIMIVTKAYIEIAMAEAAKEFESVYKKDLKQ